MAKKLLNLCMALAMVLVLLPIQVMGKTEVMDCTQYLTEDVIKESDLTLDGIPFYEISIQESISHLPTSMIPTEISESQTDKDLFYFANYKDLGIRGPHFYIDQDNGSLTLNRLSISTQAEDGYGFETGIKKICLGDSLATVLKKIGVNQEGVNIIAPILLNARTKTRFSIYDERGEITASIVNESFSSSENYSVYWHHMLDDASNRYSLFWMEFKDDHLIEFTMDSSLEAEESNGALETEYIYNAANPGEDTKLPTDLLDKITDSKSAADAVGQMIDGMTSEQKSSPTGIDLATLYAETAVSKAASKTVEGEVIISADSVADVEATAKQAVSAVETALLNGGVTTARYLSKTVTLTTDETGEITIKIDPDILTTEVDKVRVETPGYALTLKTADLAEDLTEVLTIKAEEIGSGFAPGKANRKVTVKVTLPKGRTTNPVTISLPTDKGAVTYQAVVKTDGSAISSKYNPATTTMDGKVNTSGTYTVQTNEKSFTDISNKSAEMQKAILYLTSKGIINGTSATTFSPNGTINRQQVASLLMRALGKVDNSAVASFKDVSAKSSLYHEIASSKKHKIVNGYSDNTFRGTNVISRAQIITVAGRVLSSEMNYKAPSNTSTYLSKYSDTVPDFAKEMVALATRENLVVYRTDGTFSGGKNMTRGDAAIILYRLFQRIW